MSNDPIEFHLVFAGKPLVVSVKWEPDYPIGRDGGGYIARATLDGEDYRGAASWDRIDAVRSLVCWIRDCLNMNGQEFQVTLPLDKEEFRKIIYR
jgi:hypothetical protein